MWLQFVRPSQTYFSKESLPNLDPSRHIICRQKLLHRTTVLCINVKDIHLGEAGNTDSLKLTARRWNRPGPAIKVVFQPSIFRSVVQGRVFATAICTRSSKVSLESWCSKVQIVKILTSPKSTVQVYSDAYNTSGDTIILTDSNCKVCMCFAAWDRLPPSQHPFGLNNHRRPSEACCTEPSTFYQKAEVFKCIHLWLLASQNLRHPTEMWTVRQQSPSVPNLPPKDPMASILNTNLWVCFKTDRLHIAYNGMSFYSLTNPTDCISFSSQLSATQRNFNVSGAGPTISLLLRMASWPPSAPNANADILKVSRMRLKLAAGDPPSHSKSTSVSKHIADIPSGPSMMNAFVKRFSLFHLLASIICWVGDKDCSAPKPARIFAMCSSSKKTNNTRGFGSMSPRRPEGFHSTFHTRSPSAGTVSSLTVMSGSLSASCMAWKAVVFAEQCTGALFSFKHISFGCNSCATRGRWWGGGGGGGLGLGWWWGRGSKDPQAAAMASRGGCCLEPNELPLDSLYIADFADLLWI